MKCKEIICDVCGRHVNKESTRRLWMKTCFETYCFEMDGEAMPYIATHFGRADICEDCIKEIANRVISMEESK